MRGISRMTGGALCWYKLDGLITMFNGHFFKGLGQVMSGGRRSKKETKELVKVQSENK